MKILDQIDALTVSGGQTQRFLPPRFGVDVPPPDSMPTPIEPIAALDLF